MEWCQRTFALASLAQPLNRARVGIGTGSIVERKQLW
jgi:hypothetical protein